MNLVCIFDKQIRDLHSWPWDAWTEDATSLSHDICLCNSRYTSCVSVQSERGDRVRTDIIIIETLTVCAEYV